MKNVNRMNLINLDLFSHPNRLQRDRQLLGSSEALGPIKEPRYWFGVVEEFCYFIENAARQSGNMS